MPYKLNKIIFQRDREWGYETYSYTLNTEIDFPYAAGMLQKLTPKEPSETKNYKPEISDLPLFNEKGLGKLIPEVGPKGIYYLELKPGHKLKQLVVEPEDVVVDIYFGREDTLIYSFYNPTRRESIAITASIEKDTEDVYSQIKTEPKDLIMRQYYIKRALQSSSESVKEKTKVQKFTKEILTADEAAIYSRMKKKTLQNYASEGKIKSLKGGKYRRTDLDEYLEQKKKK